MDASLVKKIMTGHRVPSACDYWINHGFSRRVDILGIDVLCFLKLSTDYGLWIVGYTQGGGSDGIDGDFHGPP